MANGRKPYRTTPGAKLNPNSSISLLSDGSRADVGISLVFFDQSRRCLVGEELVESRNATRPIAM